MKRKNIIVVINLLLFFNFLYSYDFTEVDSMYHKGMYSDGLNKLLPMHDNNNPNAEVIWRITRMYYEIGEEFSGDKKEKINKFTFGVDFAKPFLNIKEGENEDRAQVVFWYAACIGARGEVIGIKESLDTIPVLFDLADKAISIDPMYAAPYLLKGRIDDAVPVLLGGNKFRMGMNFSKAAQLDPTDLNILVDSAKAFIKRNWDAEKKEKKSKENNEKTDGTPQNLTDKEYAKELLDDAISVYLKMKDPSNRDTMKYQEAQELLNKIK